MTYTHGHADSVLRSHRWRSAENSASYLVPSLQPGQSLLDVGAGPATISADLARLVAPGEVTALEVSAEALAVTERGLADAGVSGVRLVVGDAQQLDFPEHSFDVVHAHQVLQHLADPVGALREMLRVVRPGGVVAARDSDYAGFAWAPALPGLDHWMRLYQAAARANGGEPNAGRHLLGWAHQAGGKVTYANSSTWCFATAEDRAYWGGMWSERILTSALTEQLLRDKLASAADLQEISRTWQEWVNQPDAWFSVLHGELLLTAEPT